VVPTVTYPVESTTWEHPVPEELLLEDDELDELDELVAVTHTPPVQLRFALQVLLP
jgi:hypothetical protein